jgi:predicted Zn-dependent protease
MRIRRFNLCRWLLALLLALPVGEFLPVSPPAAATGAPAPAGADPFSIDRGDFELGLEVALAVAQEIGLVEDDALLTRLYEIGSRIAVSAHDPSTVTTFHVVAMDEPNAFAVPGGFIFVTEGMIDLELSDDALANLLGHEITHVRNQHSARMGTWNAISSLVHTAVLIGLAIGAGKSSGSASEYEDEFGNERVTMSGSQAAFQGAAVFGSVFRELFLRGFSRKLEAEADEVGYRLATRAGYAPLGGVEMLETLHRHVFEQAGYGYWRTHPYFVDRARSARARVGQAVAPADSAEVAEYRLRAQATLVRQARRETGASADFLYRAAVRAGPGRGAAANVEHEIIRFRATREDSKPMLARRLGPIVSAAESALARLERSGTAADELAPLRAELDRLERELADNLEGVIEVLDAPGAASNATLEVFLVNYPDHPRADAVRLSLARRYLRQGRPDAATPLLTCLAPAETDSLEEAGRTELLRALDVITDPSVCYSVVDASPDSEVVNLAHARMQTLVSDIDSLEVGGRFLKRWPDTPYTGEVRERVSTLATDAARFARVYEVGGKPQNALDLYNRVVLLAPGTAAAAEALRGIERIQHLAES